MTHTPRAEERLAALGLTLPRPATPVAAYVPFRRAGSLVYVSGQIPISEGRLLFQGRVPDEVTSEEARECAARCALNGLAVLKEAAGSLDALRQVVRLGVFVSCGPGFTEHPKIANGASELLVEVFGDRGRHARAAVGAPSLPLGAPVEVEFIFEIEGA